MKETTPQVRYQIHDEQLAEHQKGVESAFDLLFEEVLRMRSAAGYVQHHVAPADSTPAGG